MKHYKVSQLKYLINKCESRLQEYSKELGNSIPGTPKYYYLERVIAGCREEIYEYKHIIQNVRIRAKRREYLITGTERLLNDSNIIAPSFDSLHIGKNIIYGTRIC